jgi:CRISPR/Cas system endoribonuclease Cas6 (RAMP superfamily)
MLLRDAEEIKITNENLCWYDWERYSARQKDLMKFGGLKGEITFTGNLNPFMPYLSLAEMVNVGQETSFGLGRIIIEIQKNVSTEESL